MGILWPHKKHFLLFFCRALLGRLSAQVARSFQKLVNNFNTIVVQLGTHFHGRESQQSRLFNFTIKNHVMEHIAVDASKINPCLVWGYPSEDFLMRVRRLVQSSAHGPSPMRIQMNVMKKYGHAMHLELLPGLPLLA